MKKRNLYKYTFPIYSIVFAAFVLIGISCEKDIQEWEPDTSVMVIPDYLKTDPDQFSEFSRALEITGIENLLKVRGPFTLLAPVNSAMQEYYTELGVTSIEQIDVTTLNNMVENHIFYMSISTAAMGLGTLPSENILGDYVACDLPGSDILLNKQAVIIRRDREVSNGFVHHIDNVLEPIVTPVYDVMVNDGGYTIFTEGLSLCGLADTLNKIDFDYGNSTARNRYTILAVPDTLYNRFGINTVNDLISTYSNDDDLTNIDNNFYQYMEFHCLSGTHYFSDFEADDIYYLVSNSNYLNIKVEEEFKINKSDTGYTGFYYDQSNIPAKNGAIHTVNTLLPNVEAEPVTIVFQTTDYFDLQQESYYLTHYERFYDGENTFEGIKWDAEYLMYYIKHEANGFIDHDALALNGHFWVEITTPNIRAGKYEFGTRVMWGAGHAKMNCFFDGEFLGPVDPDTGFDWGGDDILVVGEVEFETTGTHTVRFKSTTPGTLFWDRVVFTPIE